MNPFCELEFKKEISVSDIITIAITIVGIGLGYISLRQQIEAADSLEKSIKLAEITKDLYTDVANCQKSVTDLRDVSYVNFKSKTTETLIVCRNDLSKSISPLKIMAAKKSEGYEIDLLNMLREVTKNLENQIDFVISTNDVLPAEESLDFQTEVSKNLRFLIKNDNDKVVDIKKIKTLLISDL